MAKARVLQVKSGKEWVTLGRVIGGKGKNRRVRLTRVGMDLLDAGGCEAEERMGREAVIRTDSHCRVIDESKAESTAPIAKASKKAAKKTKASKKSGDDKPKKSAKKSTKKKAATKG